MWFPSWRSTQLESPLVNANLAWVGSQPVSLLPEVTALNILFSYLLADAGQYKAFMKLAFTASNLNFNWFTKAPFFIAFGVQKCFSTAETMKNTWPLGWKVKTTVKKCFSTQMQKLGFRCFLAFASGSEYYLNTLIYINYLKGI